MLVSIYLQFASALLPLALTAYILVANKVGLPVPSTANQKLVEASLRFAQGAVLNAHTKGLSITSPAVIADVISKASSLLTGNYAETLTKAGADTSELVDHFASSATAAAIASLSKSLNGPSPTP